MIEFDFDNIISKLMAEKILSIIKEKKRIKAIEIANILGTDRSVRRKGDKLTVRLGDEEKTLGITQARKERGYLTFQIGDGRYKYYIRKRKLEKM